MDNAAGVQDLDRLDDLKEYLSELRPGDASFFLQQRLEAAAAGQLHDQEMDLLPALQREDLDDAGIADLARQVDLALDAQEFLFVLHQPRVEEFDRHPGVEGHVQGFKDNAEAALADQLLQAIAVVDHRALSQLDQVEVVELQRAAVFPALAAAAAAEGPCVVHHIDPALCREKDSGENSSNFARVKQLAAAALLAPAFMACYHFFARGGKNMKKTMLALMMLLPLLAPAQEPVAFETYFVDRTMRIDVYHTGDAKEELFTIDRVVQEGPWAGNPAPPHRPLRAGALPAARERRRLRDDSSTARASTAISANTRPPSRE